jgi:hypothetical protein
MPNAVAAAMLGTQSPPASAAPQERGGLAEAVAECRPGDAEHRARTGTADEQQRHPW